MILSEKDIRRFWSKVDIKGEDECWPWIALAKLETGYGVLNIWVEEGKRRNVVASRISCFLAHGAPQNPWEHALHSCDNPPCCNPNHLRWGTRKDNMQDAVKRGRLVPPPDTHSHPEWNAKRLAAMPKGDKVWNQSLTEELVREVWSLHFEGYSAAEISAKLGVGKHPAYDACRGRSWRHLPDAPSIEELKKGGVRRGFNQFSRTDTPL